MDVSADLRIRSFVDHGLGNASHLLDIGSGRAAVVDPPRDVDRIVEHAARAKLVLTHAVETHLHADFISGSRELAANGAKVVAPRHADLAFGNRGLTDGEELDLGELTLQAIATPGHTPEHLSYLLLDGRQPRALFSGGSLLVGSVARTDLIAPERTEQLARDLYRALHERILTLPDELPVYPTHGAGSFCSLGAGKERSTTIGRERQLNPLLNAPDEDAFVARLLQTFGSYPPYFLRLREVNRLGASVIGRRPALESLDLATFERHRAQGAEVIDVRPVADYASAHIPGSLANPLRPTFVSWLGWLVPHDRPLLFILASDQDRAEVVRQSLRIGHEHLLGELVGGLESWAAAGRPTNSTRLLSPGQQLLGSLVDVRQATEYAVAHVPGGMHLELGSVADRANELPASVTFMCGHGERAVAAASLAERTGREVAVLTGGPEDWAAAHHQPLASGP